MCLKVIRVISAYRIHALMQAYHVIGIRKNVFVVYQIELPVQFSSISQHSSQIEGIFFVFQELRIVVVIVQIIQYVVTMCHSLLRIKWFSQLSTQHSYTFIVYALAFDILFDMCECLFC